MADIRATPIDFDPGEKPLVRHFNASRERVESVSYL